MVLHSAFLASFVFQHPSHEALLRELKRNGQLRDFCGFKPKRVKLKNGAYKIPVSAFSKFLKKSIKCQEKLNDMFKGLVEVKKYVKNLCIYIKNILYVIGTLNKKQ